MLIINYDNETPKVGQLFYMEYQSIDNKFLQASLYFLDEEPIDKKQWMYTQIAHMEDTEDGILIDTRFQSGGMPLKYTRIATDEDLLKFISLIKEGNIVDDLPNFQNWLVSINEDNVLLKEEKERLSKS